MIKNHKKIISFLKKNPKNFFLAIISFNLFFITVSLKESARMAYYKEVCARYFAFYSYGTDEQAQRNEIITAKKIKVPLELVDAYCQRIVY